MSIKIYTKTGDKGKTSLIGGTKVSKSDLRIETYGTVDEFNSFIGLVIDYTPDEHQRVILKLVQDRLFAIGAALACDPDKKNGMHIPDLKEEDISLLEKEIDDMSAVLPVMKNFILPGGHVAVSTTHIARCVCRRTERLCVSMQQHELFIEPLIIKYINRLSDYLFMLARLTAQELKVQEIIWKGR
ncbi:MAG: cob(I)yrinic acid a,c-diamide adenosyltransferase [Bacteroidetes bacterium]|nr:cob(I)yrinic acid a,c-diamide adenosyltransferase [Bacteroidota bacterium]